MHGVLAACRFKNVAEKVIAVVQTRCDVIQFLMDMFDVTGDLFKARAVSLARFPIVFMSIL